MRKEKGIIFLVAITCVILAGLFFAGITLEGALAEASLEDEPGQELWIVRETIFSLLKRGADTDNRQEKIRLISELAQNKRWIIELKEQPILKVISDFKKNQNSDKTTAVSSVTLNSEIAAHKNILLSEHNSLRSKLPKEAVVEREFLNVFNGFAVIAPGGSLVPVRNDPNVKRIFVDSKVYPNLMDLTSIIQADKVWQATDMQGRPVTGKGMTIAIIDSGVDYTHPDFGGCTREKFLNGTCAKFAGGYNFWDNNPDPIDDYGHGTHVASIAAGNGGLKGVAPDARIYAYRVLGVVDNEESGYLSTVIAGLERAMDPNQDRSFDDHADVIHMSLGAPGSPEDLWSQVVDNAFENGAVVTVSAGNDGPIYFSIGSPAMARNALTVGAMCKPGQIGNNKYCHNEIASFSSRGPVENGNLKPDILAPGVGICAAKSNFISPEGLTHGSDCFDDKHISFSGTSMSGPAVAGVVALIKQAHPDWSPQQIKNTIKGTADDLGFEALVQGGGRVNALAAVQATKSYPTAILENRKDLFVSGIIQIYGTAFDDDFGYYMLEYGSSSKPSSWQTIATSYAPVKEGLLGTLDTSLVDSKEEFSIRLTVFDKQNHKNLDQLFLFKRLASWKPGWPQRMATDQFFHWYSPVFGDINKDGKIEIVAGSQGLFESKVYAWDADGNLLPGWPQDVNLNGGSNPALGDIDGDGYLEIAYKSTSFAVEPKSTVYVWRYDGTPLNSNWPKDIPYETASLTSPVLADVDKDGKDEIILETSILPSGGGLKIWNADGSQMYGDWDSVDSMVNDPVIADLDKDGNKEIVLLRANSLYIWDAQTGKLENGFPRSLSEIGDVYTILIGDIDGNNNYEIILDTDSGKTYSYDYNSGQFKEILDTRYFDTLSRNAQFIINGSGIIKSGYSPLTADIDNDKRFEVINASQGLLYAWKLDGSFVKGWPINLLPYNLMAGLFKDTASLGGAIGDIDGDGKNELVVSLFTGIFPYHPASIGSFMFVIDLNGHDADWPMFRYDVGHKGFYENRYAGYCGDSKIEYGEKCDDGNKNSGDGCGSLCSVEPDWLCVGEPSFCEKHNVQQDLAIEVAVEPGRQSFPSIWQDKIIWREDNDDCNFDIVVYDIPTKAKRQIAKANSPYCDLLNPSIWQDKIVWSDGSIIYLFDLSTNTQREISLGGRPAISMSPSIWQDKIVWVASYTEYTKYYESIILHDLSTNTQREIKKVDIYNSFISRADISEDKIAWQEVNPYTGEGSVYIYDLSTSIEREIAKINVATDYFMYLYPAISGDRIVWSSIASDTNNANIYVYNLSTGNQRQLTTTMALTNPAISGDKIVWSDFKDGNPYIFFYNLSTDVLRKTADSSYPLNPDIWQDKIVWQDMRNDPGDIFYMVIDEFLPVLCGDVNKNLKVNAIDIMYIADYIYSGLTGSTMTSIGDVDANGTIDLRDINYLINYRYKGGMAPLAQSGVCDSPGTSDSFGENILLEQVLAYLNKRQLAIDIPPVLNSISNKSVYVGSTLSFRLSAYDLDNGQPSTFVDLEATLKDLLVYSASGLPLGANLDSKTGLFSWNPTSSQVGTYKVFFKATDSFGASDTKAALISVVQPTPAPQGVNKTSISTINPLIAE